MKKVILLAGFCYVLASCGGSGDKSTQTEENNNSSNSATSASVEKGAELLTKSGCLTCHKEQEKLVGPAYADVAAKYEPTDANITNLVNSVTKGSTGKWGEIPMPANAVSEDDAKAMVAYILSIKKP